MLIDIVLQRYGVILVNFGFDIVAILIMAYGLYFRRHFRTDLLLSFMALNVGILVMMSVLTQVKVDIAVGFGLFAILSIIRLRSSNITQQEVAYYYLSLVLGLVNGLGIADHWLVLGLNVLVLVIMAIFDSARVRGLSYRMDIKLEGIYTDPNALMKELGEQLGATVIYYEVNEINLANRTMSIDVRARPGAGVSLPPHEKKKKHDDDHDEEHPAAAAVPQQPAPQQVVQQHAQQPVPVGAPGGAVPAGRPHPHPYPYPDNSLRHGG